MRKKLDQVENHAKLEHLLQSIDGPLIRMNKALEILQDNLDGK